VIALLAACGLWFAPLSTQTGDGAATEDPAPATFRSAEDPERVDPGTGQYVNGVVAMADESIITLLELERGMAALARGRPVTTREEHLRLQSDALAGLLVRRLAAQAGRELGIPPELVDSRAEAIEDERVGTGSVLTYGDQLRSAGLDPLGAQRATVEELYSGQWEAYVSGSTAYGGGRPAIDGFLRPGELRAFYVVNLDTLGTPDSVTLQVLQIDAAAAGSQADAEATGAELLAELHAGASLSELVDTYGSAHQRTRGVLPSQPQSRLTDPELRRFAAEAELGTLSAVLPRRDDRGQLVGIQIARVLDRTPGVPPAPFGDPELQRDIRRRVEQFREAERIQTAERRLILEAYAWTAPEGRMRAEQYRDEP
jgi:hypothetical protein